MFLPNKFYVIRNLTWKRTDKRLQCFQWQFTPEFILEKRGDEVGDLGVDTRITPHGTQYYGTYCC